MSKAEDVTTKASELLKKENEIRKNANEKEKEILDEAQKKADEIVKKAHGEANKAVSDLKDKAKELEEKRKKIIADYRKKVEEEHDKKWKNFVPSSEEEFKEWFAHYGAFEHFPAGATRLLYGRYANTIEPRWQVTPAPRDYDYVRGVYIDKPLRPEHIIGEYKKKVPMDYIDVLIPDVDKTPAGLTVYAVLFDENQGWFAWKDGKIVSMFLARVYSRNSYGQAKTWTFEIHENGKLKSREVGNLNRRTINPAERWLEIVGS